MVHLNDPDYGSFSGLRRNKIKSSMKYGRLFCFQNIFALEIPLKLIVCIKSAILGRIEAGSPFTLFTEKQAIAHTVDQPDGTALKINLTGETLTLCMV